MGISTHGAEVEESMALSHVKTSSHFCHGLPSSTACHTKANGLCQLFRPPYISQLKIFEYSNFSFNQKTKNPKLE